MKRSTILLPLLFTLAALLVYSRTNDALAPTPIPKSVEPTVLPTEVTIPTGAPTAVPQLESISEPTPTATPTPIFFSREEITAGSVVLEIPEIRIRAPIEVAEVVMGSSGPTFTRPGDNPLWIPDWSRNIGDEGIALIYGHRQWGPVPKVFTNLDDLEPGDQVIVTTAGKRLTFEVVESIVIDPENLWEVIFEYDERAREQANAQLALLTCTPWGTDRQRLIVFATLVQREIGDA